MKKLVKSGERQFLRKLIDAHREHLFSLVSYPFDPLSWRVANGLRIFRNCRSCSLTSEEVRGPARILSEVYNEKQFAAVAGDVRFVQDNFSQSKDHGIIRGLHFQPPPCAQGKLVRVTRGAVFDVAVDIRHSSPTYGKHVSAVLSAENWMQLWLPPGFAHGFCTLEPNCEVTYKVTDFYSREHDLGLAWDDPALAIPWPLGSGTPILSDKDRTHPRLKDLAAYFD